jgi:hypothetical protein
MIDPNNILPWAKLLFTSRVKSFAIFQNLKLYHTFDGE